MNLSPTHRLYVWLITFPWRSRSGQQVKPVQPTEMWVTLVCQTPRHSDSNDLFSAWGRACVFYGVCVSVFHRNRWKFKKSTREKENRSTGHYGRGGDLRNLRRCQTKQWERERMGKRVLRALRNLTTFATHFMKQRAPSNVYPSSHPVGRSIIERGERKREGEMERINKSSSVKPPKIEACVCV